MTAVATFFSMPLSTCWAILIGSFVVTAKLFYIVLAVKGQLS
jgi:hypothetical protein